VLRESVAAAWKKLNASLEGFLAAFNSQFCLKFHREFQKSR